MFQLINNILLSFLPKFNRTKTWRRFAVLIMGFIIRTSHSGVTATISDMRLEPKEYRNILHFFKSDGYDVSEIYEHWIQIALKYANVVRIGNRVLINGDHIKIPKEGLRMPGIEILHQESQNSGKSEFIEGHIYGHVGAVITNGTVSRNLPLLTELHKSPPRDKITKKAKGDTLVTQMMRMFETTAKAIGEPVIAAADAYFSTSSALIAADDAVNEKGENLVCLVTRAKSNTVGFEKPIPPTVKKRGAPRKYGAKVNLSDYFSDMSKFTKTELMLYGKLMKVRYLQVDLLWKPVKKLVRFVLVDSGMGKMLLISNSLEISAEDMITAYAFRYKIEPGFDDMKNTMGCFSYHFWTTSLEKRKKWKKTDTQPIGAEEDEKVEKAKQAMASFVCSGTIATGILSTVSFLCAQEVWSRYPGWIKTLRSNIPSIAVTKATIAYDFPHVLRSSCCLMGFNFINSWIRKDNFIFENLHEHVSDNFVA